MDFGLKLKFDNMQEDFIILNQLIYNIKPVFLSIYTHHAKVLGINLGTFIHKIRESFKALLTRLVQHQQIFLLAVGSSQRCEVSTEGQELQKQYL